MGVTHLRQVAQHVEDMDRAVAFYRGIVGLDLIARFDPPGLAFFDLGTSRLLLEAGAPSALLYLGVGVGEPLVHEPPELAVALDRRPSDVHGDILTAAPRRSAPRASVVHGGTSSPRDRARAASVGGESPAARETDEVALGVAEEGQLFGFARRTELPILVEMDHLGLRLDGHTGLPEPLGHRGDVVDAEIEQG